MINHALEIPWHGYSWLDEIIEEQAAHYGLSVQQHAVLMNEAAQHQELIESAQVQENGEEW